MLRREPVDNRCGEVCHAGIGSSGHRIIEDLRTARLRRRLGIKKGTLVSFAEDNGRIIVQPVTREFIRGLRGSLQGGPAALDHLIEERTRERTR